MSLLQFQARARSLQVFKTLPLPGAHSVLVQRALLEHLAKVYSERKSCKIDGCPKKHPTVLHTQPWERPNEDTAVGSRIGVADGTSQVSNGMASINTASCSLTGAGFSWTSMAILPVKVGRKGSENAITTYAFLDNGSSSTFCT